MGKGWPRQRWWRLLDPAAADAEVERTFDHLLDVANGVDGPTVTIRSDRPDIATLLDRHRITTLVPLGSVPPAQRESLLDRQRRIGASQLRIRHAAIDTLELLNAAGIDTRVLKGVATCELDHSTPHTRQAGDVDLAVAPDDLRRATELLAAQGCVDLPAPFDPVLWYGRAVVRPDGVEIDLHTRLFRRSPLDRSLLDEPGEPLQRVPGTAMCAARRLVHAAGHFLISPPGTRRMNGFLDIGRIVSRSDLDLGEAQQFASELGVESLVGAGIRVEAELSRRGHVLEELHRWKQPDWLERQTRLVPHRRMMLDHLGRYREVAPGHRLAYLPAWLLPSRRQQRLLAESVRASVTRITTRLSLTGSPR